MLHTQLIIYNLYIIIIDEIFVPVDQYIWSTYISKTRPRMVFLVTKVGKWTEEPRTPRFNSRFSISTATFRTWGSCFPSTVWRATVHKMTHTWGLMSFLESTRLALTCPAIVQYYSKTTFHLPNKRSSYQLLISNRDMDVNMALNDLLVHPQSCKMETLILA